MRRMIGCSLTLTALLAAAGCGGGSNRAETAPSIQPVPALVGTWVQVDGAESGHLVAGATRRGFLTIGSDQVLMDLDGVGRVHGPLAAASGAGNLDAGQLELADGTLVVAVVGSGVVATQAGAVGLNRVLEVDLERPDGSRHRLRLWSQDALTLADWHAATTGAPVLASRERLTPLPAAGLTELPAAPSQAPALRQPASEPVAQPVAAASSNDPAASLIMATNNLSGALPSLGRDLAAQPGADDAVLADMVAQHRHDRLALLEQAHQATDAVRGQLLAQADVFSADQDRFTRAAEAWLRAGR